MSLLTRLTQILSYISYKDWIFSVQGNHSYVYMQVEFDDICIDTGKVERQKGRKWLMSEHMTDSEVIQTAFLAVKTAEEHEIREKFHYNNEAVFGPHMNVKDLAENLRDGMQPLEYRPTESGEFA